MKNIIYYLSITLIFLFSFLIFPNLSSKNDGSPGGKTGSPADGNSCTQCHGSNNTGGSINITSSIPSSGYVAGSTYTINVEMTHPNFSKYGFELTAEGGNSFNPKIGAFSIIDPSTKFVGTNAVTHTINGTNGTNGKIWETDWVAPVSGQGTVTFYAAGVAADGNMQSSSDDVYTTTLVCNEATTNIKNIDNTQIVTFLDPTSQNILINSNRKIVVNSINISDISGKQILSKNKTLLPTNLDVKLLNSGLYIINITTEKNKILTKKILIP